MRLFLEGRRILTNNNIFRKKINPFLSRGTLATKKQVQIQIQLQLQIQQQLQHVCKCELMRLI
jgi:hypothetical protein